MGNFRVSNLRGLPGTKGFPGCQGLSRSRTGTVSGKLEQTHPNAHDGGQRCFWSGPTKGRIPPAYNRNSDLSTCQDFQKENWYNLEIKKGVRFFIKIIPKRTASTDSFTRTFPKVLKKK